MNEPKIAAVTVSDRASQGVYQDLGGPAIFRWLDRHLSTPYQKVYRLVPDEPEILVETLVQLADHEGCSLILTTGGTGPAPRDITPEATLEVCHKHLPGFGEKMRAASLEVVPTAILSRQLAAIRNQSLYINLPGKPSAIDDCLNAVFDAVPYCLDLIGAGYLDTDPKVYKCFRPKKKK